MKKEMDLFSQCLYGIGNQERFNLVLLRLCFSQSRQETNFVALVGRSTCEFSQMIVPQD